MFLLGAVDEEHSIVYIYDELVTNEKNVEELARLYFEGTRDIPSGGLICAPLIDPKSGPKRDYEKKTLADHFLDYGIAFIPGAINKDARIFRANTYIELGYLRIMDKCTHLISELKDYKFKPSKTDEGTLTETPMDGNDHAISALEWILMELPSDPRNLLYGVYNKKAEDLTKTEEEKLEDEYANWMFKDEIPNVSMMGGF